MRKELITKIDDSKRIFENAIKKYKPDVIIALVSGGDDSMAMYKVATMVGKVDFVVHVDTTTGIKDVTSFVMDQVIHELIIAKTPEEDYEELVLQHGFPGPSQHQNMYIKLKERALRVIQRRFQHHGSFCRINGGTAHAKQTSLIFHPEYDGIESLVIKKPSRRIMYLSGGRKDESVRRMGTVKEIHKDGNQIWVSLISNWTKSDIYFLQQAERMHRSPTSIKLGRSGECNCGSFGSPQELLEMIYHFPNDPNLKMLLNVQEALKMQNHKYWQYGHAKANSTYEELKIGKAHLCSTCINNPHHGN